jgi:undecaprenyl diphosphate synthase
MPGLHVAIIMDGNGRWAQARGMPRVAGHRAGADAVRRVVESAPGLGVDALTLYSFSSDNWQRPPAEVKALMGLLQAYLRMETGRCVAEGVRIRMIGRRDRLPLALQKTIAEAEAATRQGRTLEVRIAIDYSSRDAILRAAAQLRKEKPRKGASSREASSREAFSRLIGDAPDVDLLIRTGGEQRLSDFLLWECAYAELLFTPRMWPEFGRADLEAAIAEFYSRERRFGRIPQAAAG